MGAPIGQLTRGTTGYNRLRRSDRWLVHSRRVRAALLSAADPLVVDLGYGALPVTTLELAERLRMVRTLMARETGLLSQLRAAGLRPGKRLRVQATADGVVVAPAPDGPRTELSAVYGTFTVSPVTLPACAGALPPTVFTRWMCVTRWNTPGPSADTAPSSNHGMALGAPGQRLRTAATTLLPLLLSHVGPA